MGDKARLHKIYEEECLAKVRNIFLKMEEMKKMKSLYPYAAGG